MAAAAFSNRITPTGTRTARAHGVLIPATINANIHDVNGWVEASLWFGLAILSCTRSEHLNWTAAMAILVLVWKILKPPDREESMDPCLRRPPRDSGDPDGIASSAILLPILIESLQNEKLQPYSIALVWLKSRQNWLPGVLASAWFSRPKILAFFLCWKILDLGLKRASKSLHQVFTYGEWMIVSSLVAIGLTEYLGFVMDDENEPITNLHNLVSLSGCIGSGIAFATVDLLASADNLLHRFVFLVSIPFLVVEFTLWQAPAALPFPCSIHWIFQFLLEAEQRIGSTATPRYCWLFYWFGMMTLAMAMAPSSKTSTVVIQRKWFHLVAVLLFAPVTFYAPQLQSLAYAVAAALLLLVECLRPQLPVLNQFYASYLDTRKGEGHAMVISHLALVVGCAAPLWLSECLPAETITTSSDTRLLRILLPQWGVLTLGIGDAMGAVIGKPFGRMRWGNHRSVEGSAAMFGSMALACGIGLYHVLDDGSIDPSNIGCILLALQFVTLLEAFTVQLDNLILPLAGSAVLLLLML